MRNRKWVTVGVWIALVVGFVLIYVSLNHGPRVPARDASVLRDDIEAECVARVEMNRDTLTVWRDDDTSYRVRWQDNPDLLQQVQENDIPVTYNHGTRSRLASVLGSLAASFLPVVLVVVLLYFLFRRQMNKAGLDIMKLRQSPAKLQEKAPLTRFADVAGCADAKQQLQDVVDFLRTPGHWQRLGARIPRGILLEGPPGCGKTLLARAVAGETNAKFYSVSGSDFVELFVGVGAARMRDTFEQAVKTAPSIVFIDEIDALGRRRGSGIGGGHDEREQTLNQLFLCMDGFQTLNQVVVIGATNRADILDRALLRPGRFDRRVKVPVLDDVARLEALRIHTRGKPLAPGVDLAQLAEAVRGFTGAEVENLANEAALLAGRRLRSAPPSTSVQISPDDFSQAVASTTRRALRFTAVDAVLAESASQFTEPPGDAWVKLTLRDGRTEEGKVVWADAAYLKVAARAPGGAASPHCPAAASGLVGTQLPGQCGQRDRCGFAWPPGCARDVKPNSRKPVVDVLCC